MQWKIEIYETNTFELWALFFSTFTHEQLEWVSNFNSLSQTMDRKVHEIDVSHVIITYTLESLSSFIQRIHNPQVTIKLNKSGLNAEIPSAA